MNTRTALLSLLLLTISPPSNASAPLLLTLGEQRSIPAENLKNFSLGHPGIVKATVLNFGGQKRILIKAASPGNTDLWIWSTDARPTQRAIEVLKSASAPSDPKLLRDLAQLQEAEVVFSERKIILRGKISQTAELTQLYALKQSYPALLEDWTEPTPELEASSVEKLRTFLRTQKLESRLHLDKRALEWWITGAISQKHNADTLTRRLRQIYPGLQIDLKTFADDDPTVHFRAYLLEIKKSRIQKLGLEWPTSGASLFKISSSQIESALQLDVTLDALENDGSLKVLSRPEVVVRAPGEAKLFSGGQVPLTYRTKNKTQTEWKPFGLTFHLKVKESSGERVRLDIETEVSQPDPTLQNADRVPGFQINQMQTQVDAAYGKPLFLSGLIQQSLRESVQGLPFLKDIPVLGKLFGSRDFQTQKSELVAILLPEHTPPSALWNGTHVEIRRASVPRGWIPVPRNWMSPDEETRLRQSANYPFNALNAPQGGASSHD